MQLVDIVTITLESSLLIFCILYIRVTWGQQLHPWVMKCLWGLLGLRILVPVRFSLFDELFETWMDSEWWHRIASVLRVEGAMKWVHILWAVGCIVCFVFFLLKNMSFDKMLKKHREVYGRKDGVLVYFVDGDIGSCLGGLMFPKIYISRLAECSVDWCKWIVRHELCHYRFWDNWYGFVRNACLVLQWFNPLMWYAAKCWVEDCELACDYQVLKNENREEQVIYGKCLVAMAARRPENFLQSLTTGNSLSDGSLEKRIRRIGKQEYGSVRMEVCTVVAMIIMLLGCFMGPSACKNAGVYVLDQIPFIEEHVFIYTMENAKAGDREELMNNMRLRKEWKCYKDATVMEVGHNEVALIFSPFQEAPIIPFQTYADVIAYDRALMFVMEDKSFFVDVEESNLLLKENGEESSLWIKMDADWKDDLDVETYQVGDAYYRMYTGNREDIDGEMVCIYRGLLADVEEIKEDLLLRNPCEITER